LIPRSDGALECGNLSPLWHDGLQSSDKSPHSKEAWLLEKAKYILIKSASTRIGRKWTEAPACRGLGHFGDEK